MEHHRLNWRYQVLGLERTLRKPQRAQVECIEYKEMDMWTRDLKSVYFLDIKINTRLFVIKKLKKTFVLNLSWFIVWNWFFLVYFANLFSATEPIFTGTGSIDFSLYLLFQPICLETIVLQDESIELWSRMPPFMLRIAKELLKKRLISCVLANFAEI